MPYPELNYLIAKERTADFMRAAERRQLISEVRANHPRDSDAVVRARFYVLLRRRPRADQEMAAATPATATTRSATATATPP